MMRGIVNVIKPTGMTSHDVVGCLRHLYGIKKVGHAGTLDPLAAGVLPVYLGNATRLIEYGDSDCKTYHGEFILGLATDTEDITGTVIETRPLPPLTFADVAAVLPAFSGTIRQRPSVYSAITIGGVKAYTLARKQVPVVMPERQVTIHAIRLLAYEGGRGLLAVTCSKGTYIRSLIRDIGEALGTCACMSYLVRVRAGMFHIEDAVTLEALATAPEHYVLPADRAIGHLPPVYLSAAQCRDLRCGRAVPVPETLAVEETVLRAYGEDRQLIGIVHVDKKHHRLRPHKMFMEE